MARIKHYLKINAPADKVYRALTEQQGLAGWWTTEAIAQPVVGSVAEFKFGSRYHDKMRILVLNKNRIVKWECFEGDKEWIGTYFQFELKGADNYTHLRFEHGGWREESDFFASCNYIWGTYMTSLKNYCESGEGSPFNG